MGAKLVPFAGRRSNIKQQLIASGQVIVESNTSRHANTHAADPRAQAIRR